jgi:hypothetical protein
MAELYIANGTKQIYQFAYRVPERSGVVTQVIPIGGQVRIAPNGTDYNLSQPVIDSILKQWSKYGLTPVADLDTLRGPFNGICYSVGKPVSVDRLRRAMERREGELENWGKEMRKQAAVAAHDKIEAETGLNIRELEMSVEEVEPRGGYTDEHRHVSEGVRVTRQNGPATPPRGRRK